MGGGGAATATVPMGSINQARIQTQNRDRIGMRMRGYRSLRGKGRRARSVFCPCIEHNLTNRLLVFNLGITKSRGLTTQMYPAYIAYSSTCILAYWIV